MIRVDIWRTTIKRCPRKMLTTATGMEAMLKKEAHKNCHPDIPQPSSLATRQVEPISLFFPIR